MSNKKAFLRPFRSSRGGWVVRVISEQDHQHGPDSYSHETLAYRSGQAAKAAAHEWADEHGFNLYAADELTCPAP